jgi:hypothetical protein
MKKLNLIAATLVLMVMVSCDRPSKVSYLEYKAPYEIQKHFNYPIKWNAVRQERWVNGKLWVEERNGWKCIIMKRDLEVEPPKGATSVSLK